MFVHSDASILLEDGVGYSLPAPVKGSYNFSFMPTGSARPTVAVSSAWHDLTLRCSELLEDDSEGVAFSASGKNYLPVHIDMEKLKNKGNPLMRVTVENLGTQIAEEFNEVTTNMELFDLKNRIQIQGSNEIVELVPNSKAGFVIVAGLCSNFRFEKAARSVALVSVQTLTMGQVSLFVKKGAGEMATPTNFDLKTHSFVSDVLTIEASDPKRSSEMKDEYSLAVCSSVTSMFVVVLNVDTEDPVFTIAPGEILRKVITKGKSHLVHFIAGKGDQLSLNTDSEKSRIIVYKSEFQNSIDMTNLKEIAPKQDQNSLVFTTNSPGIPCSSILDVGTSSNQVHYLFRIVPQETDLVTFYIISLKHPVQIELKQNERLQERLDATESRSYLLRSADLENCFNLSVRLDYGQLTIHYHSKGSDTVKADLMDGNTEKVKTFSLTSNDSSKSLLSNLFSETIVTITAKRNSLFELTYEPPNGFFKPISPGVRIAINNSKGVSNPVYYYQTKDPEGTTSFKLFIILDKRLDNSFDQSMFFSEKGFRDLVMEHFTFHFLNSEQFGLEDTDFASKTVADVKSIDYIDSGDRKYLYLTFAVQKGVFLIGYQNKQDLQNLGIAFELSLNYYFTVKANSYNIEYAYPNMPSESQIQVTSKGTLFVDVEDCSGLIQAYGSKDIEETKGAVSSRTVLTSKNFTFDEPGFFYISVVQKRKDSTADAIPFILRTEFLDASKEHLLSSYFKDMGSKGEILASKVNIYPYSSEVLTKKRSDRWESLKVQPIHLLPHNFIVDSVRSFLTSKMWVRSFIRTGQGHWYCRTFPCNEFSRLQFVVRESASFSRLR